MSAESKMTEFETKLIVLVDMLKDIVRDTSISTAFAKYNIYLNTKAVVFAALLQQGLEVDEAIEQTEYVIGELDLDTKARLAAEETAKQTEE